MAKKTKDEQLDELKKKINAMRKQVRKIENEKKEEERKHRNHVMIVIATHLLTKAPKGTEELLLQLEDDDVKAWVDALDVIYPELLNQNQTSDAPKSASDGPMQASEAVAVGSENAAYSEGGSEYEPDYYAESHRLPYEYDA